MTDVFAAVFSTFLAACAAVAMLARRSQTEQRWILSAYLLHVVGVFFQVWLHEDYYGGGDMNLYTGIGANIARLMAMDVVRFAPEVVRLLLHLPNELPVYILGEGNATGSMAALTGMLFFVLGGVSLRGACLVVMTFCFWGKLLLFDVTKDFVTEKERLLAFLAFMAVPSAVAWTCLMAKETYAVGGLGILTYGAHRFFRGRGFGHLIMMALGALFVGTTKPYVLFPFVLAAGGYVLATSKRRLAPIQLVGALIVAVGGLALVGQLFPEFSVENIEETAAAQQSSGRMAKGGSYIEIDSGRGLAGQLAFLPLALVNSLLRPFLFEVRNGPMAGAALETTALLVLFVSLILRFKLRTLVATVRTTPVLMFAFIFSITFGAAVGLVTTNLGTLSRYRVPMMPFVALLLLLLRARLAPSVERVVARVPLARQPTRR